MTETSSFNRQPSNLDYAANTQFRFLIDKLPKTEFFVKAANIPGVSIGEVTQPTPLSNITLPGDTLSFENLNITFIVDEFFNNYIEVQDWMRGTAFPVDHKEYLDLLRTGRDKSPQSIPSRVSIEEEKLVMHLTMHLSILMVYLQYCLQKTTQSQRLDLEIYTRFLYQV